MKSYLFPIVYSRILHVRPIQFTFFPHPLPPLLSFRFTSFYFFFFSTPRFHNTYAETLKKILITETLSLPRPFLLRTIVMKAENRIFQRGVKKKKVETTGEEGHFHLASGQSASEPRSMIGNLQKSLGGFGSPPSLLRFGFTSLRDRTNARPSNGFAVRITLCVEAAAEKCNGEGAGEAGGRKGLLSA